MENNWIELDQGKYESICFLLNKKILIEEKILLYSEPEYEVVKEVVKKTFGGSKDITKKYLKSIRLVNIDLTENTISKGWGNLEYLHNLIKWYNVETLRKNYLNIERQFKMFQVYEDKQIEKEFITAKSL